MTFYDRYQQLCVEAGSSATGVAVSVGISRASVSDWKNKGAVPSASLNVLSSVATSVLSSMLLNPPTV